MQIEQSLKYPVKPGTHWEGGVVDFTDVAAAAPGSPVADAQLVLWVCCEKDVVHAKPSIDQGAFELLVAELLEFMEAQQLHYLPETISVTDRGLAKELGKLLAGAGTAVSWDPDPEHWCEVFEQMAADLSNSSTGRASVAMTDTKCTTSQMQAFGEAAAAFYRARPWQHLTDTDLLKFITPKPPKNLKYATVLGAGKQEYGLGFYDSSDTHWNLRAQRMELNSVEAFSVVFIPVSEAAEQDVAFWRQHDISIATGDAFPLFLLYANETARVPTAKELEFATIVLAALAESTEEELDSGEWSKQVSVEGKNRRCKLSIPDLLKTPSAAQWMERGFMPERRGNERHLRMIQNVVRQNEGMDLNELNELLSNQFTGPLADMDQPPETPFDRAENLCSEAISTYGRRRIQLARQALQEDPTHVEANIVLAESTNDIEQKILRYEAAIALGEEQCAAFFEDSIGHFWGIPQTRPLIRAKHGLAWSLAADGQTNAAIAQMLDILRLNENDNLAVRCEVVPMLLTQNREEEANAILDRYTDESASWLYLKAQVAYRAGGPGSRSAQAAMAAAIKLNPHVFELLAADEPPMEVDHYSLGSPEEAAVVIHEQVESWFECEGFADWMVKSFETSQREAMKRNREQKRRALAKKRKRKLR